MAAANFDACLAHILAFEGGYVNDPRDPGGETNFGISKRTYPSEDIRGMTRARAAQIYRRDFWNAVRGDDLPAGLDLVAFDAAVNSGRRRGAEWLQKALGVPADGKIGPITVAAAVAADAPRVIAKATDLRMAFLRGLATWGTYANGWSRRVESVKATALAMHEKTRPALPPPLPQVPIPSTEPPASLSTAVWIAIAVGLLIVASMIFGG